MLNGRNAWQLVAVCSLLGLVVACGDSASGEPTELEGSWTGFELGGPTTPWTFSFSGDNVTAEAAGQEVYQARLIIIQNTSPKRADYEITASNIPGYAGKVSHTIFKIEGTNKLTISANEPGNPQTPAVFVPGGGARIFELTKK